VLRPLSIQEYALIQQFPQDWKFSGKLISIYKQIGNAVPVGLGYMAGKAILDHINKRGNKSFKGSTSRYKRLSAEEFIEDFEKKHFSHEKVIQQHLFLTA
jgi:DNA (cytosine-5)-methyltransferase 1